VTDQLPIGFEPPLRLHDMPERPEFFGPGYEPKLDQERFKGHCAAVLEVLRSSPGRWWTYEELAEASAVPAGSVRTRVSNLRKWHHEIETRTRPDRFREVRLVRPGGGA
jgi:hypothetical protein